LAVYERARQIAAERGILLADTKLEFGRSRLDGTLLLGDEVLTPDSSRFWSADGYREGQVQPSLDKQFVRDWLTSPASGWHRRAAVSTRTRGSPAERSAPLVLPIGCDLSALTSRLLVLGPAFSILPSRP